MSKRVIFLIAGIGLLSAGLGDDSFPILVHRSTSAQLISMGKEVTRELA